MGSYMMHLGISEKYRKSHGYSEKFLAGSIMPDIVKRSTENREKSHYFHDEKISNGKVIKLPNIDYFIKENKEKNKDEFVIGYLAHLIEDYIWFKEFIPTFATCEHINGEDYYRYKKEDFSVLHESSDFYKELYADYTALEKIILKQIPIDIAEVKKISTDYFNSYKKALEVIESDLVFHTSDPKRKLFFIREEEWDRYVSMSLEMLEEKLNEFIK